MWEIVAARGKSVATKALRHKSLTMRNAADCCFATETQGHSKKVCPKSHRHEVFLSKFRELSANFANSA